MILDLPPEVIGGVGTFVGAALGAWNSRQGRQIRDLTDRLNRADTWRDSATVYIGQLLLVMLTHGVTPPTPPPVLGISIPGPLPTTGPVPAGDAPPPTGGADLS